MAADRTGAVHPAERPAGEGKPATPAAVRLEGVRKRYGDVEAVAGIDLEIRSGEFFSMLGPSGSGKTTTLRMIAGFELPSEGRILLDGRDVTGEPPFERDVNTVFQDYALFPHMTVGDNVAYGLMVRKVPAGRAPHAGRRGAAHGAPGRLTTGAEPAQLSGGQRQRVALARALVNRPRVLLLDEPLGALDLKLREEMQIELKAIQQQVGITFIYVTHDQEEALTMSDRLAVFNAGRIEQVGTPAEVYERPATGVRRRLRRDVEPAPRRRRAADRRRGAARSPCGRRRSGSAEPDDRGGRATRRCGTGTRPRRRVPRPGHALHRRPRRGRASWSSTQQNLDDIVHGGAGRPGPPVRLVWKRQHVLRVVPSSDG